MPNHQEVLFWVFIGFFILIGIVSLLVMIGVLHATSAVRKLAIGGFAAEVVTAVVALFKMSFAPGARCGSIWFRRRAFPRKTSPSIWVSIGMRSLVLTAHRAK